MRLFFLITLVIAMAKMAMVWKRVMVRAARAMATATRVTDDEKGEGDEEGDEDKEGDGDDDVSGG
jgi:hypothetical protein